MTDLSVFRVYEPHELGADGYPLVWHTGIVQHDPDCPRDPCVCADTQWADGTYPRAVGVKDIVREQAAQRCVRCGHPYSPGRAVWENPQAVTSKQFMGYPLTLDDVEAMSLEVTDERVLEPKPGKGTLWSPCDEHCTHGGPVRVTFDSGVVTEMETQRAGGLLSPSNVEKVEAAWRVLTVHHLNKRKHDLRWWNLVSCCQRCHLQIQGKVQMERVYPFEHTDWFKPYAAGWYGYAYLGESLTREQVDARLDELLALERLA